MRFKSHRYLANVKLSSQTRLRTHHLRSDLDVARERAASRIARSRRRRERREHSARLQRARRRMRRIGARSMSERIERRSGIALRASKECLARRARRASRVRRSLRIDMQMQRVARRVSRLRRRYVLRRTKRSTLDSLYNSRVTPTCATLHISQNTLAPVANAIGHHFSVFCLHCTSIALDEKTRKLRSASHRIVHASDASTNTSSAQHSALRENAMLRNTARYKRYARRRRLFAFLRQ
jgi:hypothetical protein